MPRHVRVLLRDVVFSSDGVPRLNVRIQPGSSSSGAGSVDGGLEELNVLDGSHVPETTTLHSGWLYPSPIRPASPFEEATGTPFEPDLQPVLQPDLQPYTAAWPSLRSSNRPSRSSSNSSNSSNSSSSSSSSSSSNSTFHSCDLGDATLHDRLAELHTFVKLLHARTSKHLDELRIESARFTC